MAITALLIIIGLSLKLTRSLLRPIHVITAEATRFAAENGTDAEITHTKSWKNTTVTITNTDWTSDSFVIQDWADWQGSWDMLASVYDPDWVADDAFDYNNMKNKPTIPSTAADVWALPNTTKYWASLDLSLNTTTYVITAQLKDQDWNNLWTAKTIDLPLESVVVSGSYNKTTKEVELVLENWTKITFSVADLVAWLQSEITTTNKLDADLVDDSTSTHKFVTSTEKSTWNWKQDAIQDLATIRLNASAWANAASTIANYWDIVTHDADEFAAATHTHQISDVSWLQTALNWKAASTHSHAISDVTGLQDALDGKAASSHTHAISDVTWLSDALAGKADASDLDTLENTVSNLSDTVDWKQDKLVSWTNIKSVNWNSLLGSWNLVLHSSISVTLSASWWSNKTQTVTATWVSSSNSVVVSPAPANIEDYTESKIYCSAQWTNTLTFTCDTVPSSAITVNVVILN